MLTHELRALPAAIDDPHCAGVTTSSLPRQRGNAACHCGCCRRIGTPRVHAHRRVACRCRIYPVIECERMRIESAAPEFQLPGRSEGMTQRCTGSLKIELNASAAKTPAEFIPPTLRRVFFFCDAARWKTSRPAWDKSGVRTGWCCTDTSASVYFASRARVVRAQGPSKLNSSCWLELPSISRTINPTEEVSSGHPKPRRYFSFRRISL